MESPIIPFQVPSSSLVPQALSGGGLKSYVKFMRFIRACQTSGYMPEKQ